MVFIKKKWLILGGVILGIGAISGIVAGGFASSKNADPYRTYYKQPTGDSVQDLISSYYAAVIEGARLLDLPGFTHQVPLETALPEQKFDNTGFMLLDSNAITPFTSQIATIQYRVDQGSFLVGIALGMYLNDYKDYFAPNATELTWATYGGWNFSSVTSYMAGFQNGIRWFNENIVPKHPGMLPLVEKFIGPTNNDNFAGGFGPSQGNTMIARLLQLGINALIPVAGPQSVTAVNMIAAQKLRTALIGVDSPLEKSGAVSNLYLPKPSSSNVKYPGRIVAFSSLKNLDTTSFQMMKYIDEGISYTDPGDHDIGGFGFNSLGTLANGGVGISDAGKPYFIQAMKLLKPSINTYQDAVSLLESEPGYQKAVSPEGMVFWSTPEFNKNPPNDPKKYNEHGAFTFSLPLHGTAYPKMPMEVPSDLIGKITQPEWTKRRDFNLKGFIVRGDQADTNKIKEILSSSTSILLDQSFSETTYIGLWMFFKYYQINIPAVPAGGV